MTRAFFLNAAPRASPLRYARDGDGWRIWSVGLDQIDGGGVSDAYTERDRSRQKNADFVLTSRERELRKAGKAD